MSESMVPPAPPPHGLARLAGWLGDERERGVLWLPVGVGLGIGVYFALPVEPVPWLAGAILLAILAFLAAARGRPGFLLLLIGLAAVAAGFIAAQVRTILVEAPMLERRIGPLTVEGRVVEVEPLGRGRRVLLDELQISGVAAASTPRRVRIRLGSEPPLAPGSRIRVRAVLSPPPAPAVP
ncbi:MAG: DUF4131 domain-containing protein, partial [Rhodospirillales bacterium]|nr:DUF4131 domain-containing protein [Rhodospirillales bacterium]